jgi:cell division protein FtsI/penicillin-binding protein 2
MKRSLSRGRELNLEKPYNLTEAKMCDRKGKVLAHGTSKLMVTRDKQSIKDVVDYVGSSKLPRKFLRS